MGTVGCKSDYLCICQPLKMLHTFTPNTRVGCFFTKFQLLQSNLVLVCDLEVSDCIIITLHLLEVVQQQHSVCMNMPGMILVFPLLSSYNNWLRTSICTRNMYHDLLIITFILLLTSLVLCSICIRDEYYKCLIVTFHLALLLTSLVVVYVLEMSTMIVLSSLTYY